MNWKKDRSSRHPEIILLLCMAITWWMRYSLPFDSKMGISVFQYVHLLEDIRPGDRIFANREPVPAIPHSVPTNNIILVIDESLRGDHISINGYNRDTTPALEKLSKKGWVTNWGLSAASATCSIFSNPHILTGVPSTGNLDNRLTSRWPTLFQYAKAMGYKTYYLDAQEAYLWNGLLQKDLDYVDVHRTTDDFSKTLFSDQKAAQYIHSQVTQSTGNFIVLNKMGIHILYENNYPPLEAKWQPTPENFNYKNPQRVINAYDNAVRYNLETFFTILMPDLNGLPDTILLYTSDHGDTLQEHGESWSHCHNTKPEATVPLFMIGVLPGPVDTSFKASHANITPTLLDLMKVPENARVHAYASSLLTAKTADSEVRYFLDGDLKSEKFDETH